MKEPDLLFPANEDGTPSGVIKALKLGVIDLFIQFNKYLLSTSHAVTF
jgi:hypothetical protein